MFVDAGGADAAAEIQNALLFTAYLSINLKKCMYIKWFT